MRQSVRGNTEISGDAKPTDALLSSFEQPAIKEVSYEFQLKLFMVALFLPEGLSVMIGEVRLPLVRILTMIYMFTVLQSRRSLGSIRFPSDTIALIAAVWMILAGMVTEGVVVGLKSAGALALDFVGAYFIFRRLPNAPDVSVNVIKFTAKVMIVVVAVAMLDPLSGHLFVHDLVGKITGWYKTYSFEQESFFRNGLVRAMGPMEHSILFAAACAWFGVLTLCMCGVRLFSAIVGLTMAVGIWFSQARAPLAAYAAGLGLMTLYFCTKQFAWRWKFVGCLIVSWLLVVFIGSRNPISTLMSFGGVDPSAGWYREVIWETAGPAVLDHPLFGLGLFGQWDWQSSDVLVGPTVDSLWLNSAMLFGIPGSLLIFLTIASPFWVGSVDRSEHLTEGERRLSVALGIVTFMAVFVGFTVHMWGIDWILLGVFAGMRTNIMESAQVRGAAARNVNE